MLEALQLVATLSAALFAGAAIYINVAEHPARMGLDTRSAASQWAPNYKRATWMQAPLAIISFLAGVGVWLLGGGLMWLVAALFIGAVVPVTFMVIMPTNHRLLAVGRDLGSEETRQLLQRWGKLHGVRSIASGIATILMLWGLALCTAAYGQTFPEPRTLRINDRVFVLLGPIQHANRSNQGYMINSTVIVGDKGVILVDSGGSDEVGRHIASAVRRITQKPVTHVVNTHHHGDHHLGNVAFEAATFISSEMCRKMVLETGREWLAIMERDIGRRLPGTTPVAAQVTYPEGTRTQRFIHGVRLVFWVPRGSHTAGDLLVHLPDDDVLVAGDVLVSRVVPTLQDGFVKNWIQTLDEIRALGVAHFVPGHGDLMTVNDVDALREAMFRFHSGVKEGFRRGQNEAQIRRSLDLSVWNRLERSYVIGRNINQAYLEIEADSFDE